VHLSALNIYSTAPLPNGKHIESRDPGVIHSVLFFPVGYNYHNYLIFFIESPELKIQSF